MKRYASEIFFTTMAITIHKIRTTWKSTRSIVIYTVMGRCLVSMHAMSMEVGRSTCDATVKQRLKVLVKGPIYVGASEGNLARPALELESAVVA